MICTVVVLVEGLNFYSFKVYAASEEDAKRTAQVHNYAMSVPVVEEDE